MTRQKASDPDRRMGIYNRLEDVPDAKRLGQYADRYDGQDTWATFRASQSNAFSSDHYANTVRKTERTWKTHMTDRGRHHALARPDDVATWCRDLATDRTRGTVYTQYWVRLEEFYTWLQFHTAHPHQYHPVLMAAATCATPQQIWAQKMGRHPAREAADD
jgi:hypothetical protein